MFPHAAPFMNGFSLQFEQSFLKFRIQVRVRVKKSRPLLNHAFIGGASIRHSRLSHKTAIAVAAVDAGEIKMNLFAFYH